MYILISILFLDKLPMKCKNFKEIESKMTKLLQFLDKYTARHSFRWNHLKHSKWFGH